ncbi:MAG: phosphotransferase enzyme family protein [Bythopirellula sp.]
MPSPHSQRQLQYLTPWFEDVSAGRLDSLGVTGGFSGAIVWRVSMPGSQLCLRRWPQVHPSLNGLLAIHGLLKHVATAGFDLVPVPLNTRYGESYFVHEDHLWELTPWLPGEASFAQQPSTAKLTAATRALAKFHQAAQSYSFQGESACVAPSQGLRERLSMIGNLQQGELQQLWKATRTAEASDLRELAFELLEAIGHSVGPVGARLQEIVHLPLPLQWCLRDVRHDHVLFQGEEVSGLLDFGAVAVDSVAADIARLLGSIAHDQPECWQAGIDAYCQERPLNLEERRAIASFDQGGLICSATNWVRWLFVEERSFPQIHALHDQLIWLRDRLRALAARSSASVGEQLAGPSWERTPPGQAASGGPQHSQSSPWMHT